MLQMGSSVDNLLISANVYTEAHLRRSFMRIKQVMGRLRAQMQDKNVDRTAAT